MVRVYVTTANLRVCATRCDRSTSPTGYQLQIVGPNAKLLSSAVYGYLTCLDDVSLEDERYTKLNYSEKS
jgi:hypothetical protein